MRTVVVGVLVLGLSAGESRADDPPAQEPLGLGLELGAMFSPAEGDRRDTLAAGGLALRWRRALSDRAAFVLGGSIPVPPFLMTQAIVGYERDLTAWRSTPVARATLRPMIGLVGLCESGAPERCPLDAAAEPRDRAGWAYGAAVEVGIGWRFRLTDWKRLEVSGAYLGGVFEGRARKTEAALDGYYQGFMLAADLLM